MANKVKFGFKNCYYATITEGAGGTITYGTPVALKGAVSMSLSPSGETTALYLEKILNKEGLKISRIGYGIPAGGDIEYIDELTLKRAIDARIESKK